MAATAVALTTAEPTTAPTAEPTAEPTSVGACRATGELIVGTDAAYPPFESVNTTSGAIEGFDIDLLNAIGAQGGFTLKYVNAAFNTIFTNLAAGQFDIVISASTITTDRLQTVAFSNPYFNAGQVIVVRKDDAATIKLPNDLRGKTIGVQTGTTGAEAAKGIPGVTLRSFERAPDAFKALANKDVDAVVNDDITAKTLILNTAEFSDLVLANDGIPFTSEYYGIAIRKECADLIASVNKGLAAVIADGTYADLYKKYFNVDPTKEFLKEGKGLLLSDILATPTPEPATPAPTAEPTAAPTEEMMGPMEPTAAATPSN